MNIADEFLIEDGVLKKYRGNGTSVLVPDFVTEIGFCAFMWCSSMESLRLPEGLVSIGHEAFYGCRNLKSVIFPSSLRRVESLAFSGCSSLEEIRIPEGTDCIGDGAFSGCGSLRQVFLPKALTSLGSAVFSQCPGLADADGMVVEKNVLYGYYGTGESVTVPEGICRIENGAFLQHQEIRRITLPDSVQSIGVRAFSGCTGLTDSSGFVIVKDILFHYRGFAGNVEIPPQVRVIAPSAFSFCTDLKQAALPPSVRQIGDEAFSGCTDLSRIQLSEGLTHIGIRAFWGCSSLTEIVLPESLLEIGSRAFGEMPALRRIVLKGTPSLPGEVFPNMREILLSCRLPVSAFATESIRYKAALGYLFRGDEDPSVHAEAEKSIRGYISVNISKFLDDAVRRPALLPPLAEKKLIPDERISGLLSRFSGDTVSTALLLNYRHILNHGDRAKKTLQKKVRISPDSNAQPVNASTLREIREDPSLSPEEMSEKILQHSRNVISVHLHHFSKAAGSLSPFSWSGTTLSTDGKRLFYDPDFIVSSFRKEKNRIPKLFLHTLLHCLFGHVFSGMNLNRPVWDLACDIAVENIIAEFDISDFLSGDEQQKEKEIRILSAEVKTITAGSLYRYFQEIQLPGTEIDRLKKLFNPDDHSPWYWTRAERARVLGLKDEEEKEGSGQDNGEISLIKKRARMWKTLSGQAELLAERQKEAGQRKSPSLLQNLKALHREKYDYAAFLRKFSAPAEIMKTDDNEFDYIYYTYGLNLYRDTPLIEPLEYRSVKQIREFVIAIDTSASTSGPLVQKFIQKTYNLLLSAESFSSRINLHILQCNNEIQEHVKITSRREFENYIHKMEIHGSGTTDFRPVFEKVDEMVKSGELSRLRGLLYFTDGKGTFPFSPPRYPTAFVFVDDGLEEPDVPPWAVKLILPPEEIS